MTIPLWTASVATRGVWKTLRCGFAWVLGLLLIMTVVYGVFSGKYWKYRAERSKERAMAAAAEAIIEADRRKQSEAGATIATDTRAGMDRIEIDVNLPAEQAARRMESNAQANPDPAAGRPDPVVMRELEAAADKAESAGNRLQREKSR